MGWDKSGVWDKNIHTTVYKINSKDLPYSTGLYRVERKGKQELILQAQTP